MAYTHSQIPTVIDVDVNHPGKQMRPANDRDGFGLVPVLVTRLPERLGGVVGETADHGLPARRLDLDAGRQVPERLDGAQKLTGQIGLVALVHAHRAVLLLLRARQDLTDVAEHVAAVQEHVVGRRELDRPASYGGLL